MKDKRWVQHISGQGNKWEVNDNVRCDGTWGVYAGPADRHGHRELFYLPASEYRLCEPPVEWRDITEQVEPRYDSFVGPGTHWNLSVKMPVDNGGYMFRLRKVHLETVPPEESGAYFIVERKVSQ